MYQFFVKDLKMLDDEDLKHAKVLRIKKNEIIRIVSLDSAKAYFAYLDNASLSIIKQDDNYNELSAKISAIIPLLKSDKLDFLIQKLVELGTNKIYLYEAANAVVKNNNIEKKLNRYKQIIKQAAMQSKRNLIPEIKYLKHFNETINIKADLKLIANEKSNETVKLKDDFKSIAFIIGPEGGFSLNEVSLLKEHDFKEISLGKRILRAETAGIFLAANLSFIYD